MNKNFIRAKAIEWADYCENSGPSIFDVFTRRMGPRVIPVEENLKKWTDVWKLAPEAGATCKRDTVKGETILIVTAKSPGASPVFAKLHEIAHWILKHPKPGQFMYGAHGQPLEQEAHYFAFVVACRFPEAVGDGRKAKTLTFDEIHRIARFVLVPGVIANEVELKKEMEELFAKRPVK